MRRGERNDCSDLVAHCDGRGCGVLRSAAHRHSDLVAQDRACPPAAALWGALAFLLFARGLEMGLHYLCILSDNAVSRAI